MSLNLTPIIEAAFDATDGHGTHMVTTDRVALDLGQQHLVKEAIEAAAPLIEAQTLRHTADRYRGKAKALREVAGITKTQFPMAVDVLLDLADELDRDAEKLTSTTAVQEG